MSQPVDTYFDEILYTFTLSQNMSHVFLHLPLFSFRVIWHPHVLDFSFLIFIFERVSGTSKAILGLHFVENKTAQLDSKFLLFILPLQIITICRRVFEYVVWSFSPNI